MIDDKKYFALPHFYYSRNIFHSWNDEKKNVNEVVHDSEGKKLIEVMEHEGSEVFSSLENWSWNFARWRTSKS